MILKLGKLIRMGNVLIKSMFLVSVSLSPLSPLNYISKESVNQLASKAKYSLKKKKKGLAGFSKKKKKTGSL